MCDAGATQVCSAQSLFQDLIPNGSLALWNPVVLLSFSMGPLMVWKLLEVVFSKTNKQSLAIFSQPNNKEPSPVSVHALAHSKVQLLLTGERVGLEAKILLATQLWRKPGAADFYGRE